MTNRFNPILSDMFFGSNRQKSVREKIKPVQLVKPVKLKQQKTYLISII